MTPPGTAGARQAAPHPRRDGREVVIGLDGLGEELRADVLIVVNAATEQPHRHRTLELLALGADRREHDRSTLVAAAL